MLCGEYNNITNWISQGASAYELPSIFESGETVRAINGIDFDEIAFCRVLVAAINDTRYEMDWPFAARLVK